MRQCLGRTRNLHRCSRKGQWGWFCPEHKKQPLVWLFGLFFTVVAGLASIYSVVVTWSEGSSNPAVNSPQIVILKREESKPSTNDSRWTVEVRIEYVQLRNLGNIGTQKLINDTLISDVGADKEYEGENWYYEVGSYAIKGDLLSVVSYGTYYSHGAAGAGNVIASTNLNLKTGGRVEFKDLFKSGYAERLNELALAELNKSGYGMFFEGLKEDQCYFFDGDYLALCFDEYEVAPGAAGAVTVRLPLNSIRSLISLNGPLAYAI